MTDLHRLDAVFNRRTFLLAAPDDLPAYEDMLAHVTYEPVCTRAWEECTTLREKAYKDAYLSSLRAAEVNRSGYAVSRLSFSSNFGGTRYGRMYPTYIGAHGTCLSQCPSEYRDAVLAQHEYVDKDACKCHPTLQTAYLRAALQSDDPRVQAALAPHVQSELVTALDLFERYIKEPDHVFAVMRADMGKGQQEDERAPENKDIKGVFSALLFGGSPEHQCARARSDEGLPHWFWDKDLKRMVKKSFPKKKVALRMPPKDGDPEAFNYIVAVQKCVGAFQDLVWEVNGARFREYPWFWSAVNQKLYDSQKKLSPAEKETALVKHAKNKLCSIVLCTVEQFLVHEMLWVELPRLTGRTIEQLAPIHMWDGCGVKLGPLGRYAEDFVRDLNANAAKKFPGFIAFARKPYAEPLPGFPRISPVELTADKRKEILETAEARATMQDSGVGKKRKCSEKEWAAAKKALPRKAIVGNAKQQEKLREEYPLRKYARVKEAFETGPNATCHIARTTPATYIARKETNGYVSFLVWKEKDLIENNRGVKYIVRSKFGGEDANDDSDEEDEGGEYLYAEMDFIPQWLDDLSRLTYEGFGVFPDPCAPPPATFLNTFVPPRFHTTSIAPGDADYDEEFVDRFLLHLRRVVVGAKDCAHVEFLGEQWSRDAITLLDFFASCMQNPAKKTWMPWIYGGMGGGKTMLISCLKNLFGSDLTCCANGDGAAAISNFNAAIEGKFLVDFGDVQNRFPDEFAGNLLSLITDKHTVRLTSKGKDPRSTKTCCKCVATINNLKKIPTALLSEEDRRIAVVTCSNAFKFEEKARVAAGAPKNSNHFAIMDSYLLDENSPAGIRRWASLAGFLKQHTITTDMDDPPMNESLRGYKDNHVSFMRGFMFFFISNVMLYYPTKTEIVASPTHMLNNYNAWKGKFDKKCAPQYDSQGLLDALYKEFGSDTWGACTEPSRKANARCRVYKIAGFSEFFELTHNGVLEDWLESPQDYFEYTKVTPIDGSLQMVRTNKDPEPTYVDRVEAARLVENARLLANAHSGGEEVLSLHVECSLVI